MVKIWLPLSSTSFALASLNSPGALVIILIADIQVLNMKNEKKRSPISLDFCVANTKLGTKRKICQM